MSWLNILYFIIGLLVSFWLGIKCDLKFRDLLDSRELIPFLLVIVLWPVVLVGLSFGGGDS